MTETLKKVWKDPNWSHSGHLRITGEVVLLKWKVEVHSVVVRPEMRVRDEAGVEWVLDCMATVSDLHPSKLPENFPARYTLGFKYSPHRYTVWEVDADGIADAIAQIIAHPENDWRFGKDAHAYNYIWEVDSRRLRSKTGEPPRYLSDRTHLYYPLETDHERDTEQVKD